MTIDGRLPAHLEVMAIVRRVETEGGFAAVLRKGDPDRGSLSLVLRSRGEFKGMLERELASDFRYRWVLSRSGETADDQQLQSIIAAKSRFDTDFWLIELDVADAERFIAETISAG